MSINKTGGGSPDQSTAESFTARMTQSAGQNPDLMPWETWDPWVSAQTRDLLTTVFMCYLRQLVIYLGIPGNILSGLVFWKQGLRDRINLLLFWLAVADLSSLLCQSALMPGCYIAGPLAISNWNVIKNFKISFVTLWTNTVSQTLIVVVSVDRCLSVAVPLKARRLLTYRSMAVAIPLCYVIPLLFFVPAFFAFNVKWKTDASTNQSMAYVDTPDWFPIGGVATIHIITYFTMATKPGLLFVVILCCFITLLHLRRFSRQRERMSGKSKEDDDIRITKMLLLLCLIYAVLVIPETCSSILNVTIPEYNLQRTYHNTAVVIFQFVWLAACLNSTANVFAYLTLSTRFRRSLKELCLCCWKDFPRKA